MLYVNALQLKYSYLLSLSFSCFKSLLSSNTTYYPLLKKSFASLLGKFCAYSQHLYLTHLSPNLCTDLKYLNFSFYSSLFTSFHLFLTNRCLIANTIDRCYRNFFMDSYYKIQNKQTATQNTYSPPQTNFIYLA